MRMSSRFALSALTLALGLCAQSAVHAVALTEAVSPASFADTGLPGTTAALRPELGGTVLEDSIQDFSFEGVTGTVQNRVVRTGAGTLDFSWRINVDPRSTGTGVAAFRLIDFGYEFLKDADWRIDGLGTVAPDAARLFNEATHPTGAINFLFNGGIHAGEESRFFFLHTNATAYAKTASFDLLNVGPQALSPAYQTFAPAVPEPETYALFVAGLAVAGLAARRRRAA